MSQTTNADPAVKPDVTPVTTPAASVPVDAAAENKETGKLLSTILGLIKPEEKPVTPVVADAPAAPAAAATPAAGAAPAADEKTRKPVKVTKGSPRPTADQVEEIVKRTVAAIPQPKADTPPVTPAAVTPVAPSLDHLTSDEREEVELAQYAETRDPSKKGLADKTLKFFEEQKKFLEKRITEVGEDYDPATDPKFKKFLDQNNPGLTNAERRRLAIQRETDIVKQQAKEEARKELLPEIEKTQKKLLEMEERPKVKARITSFAEDTLKGMPEEIYKFHMANGQDVDKTRAEFPDQFDHIASSLAGAVRLGEEFLNVRRGLSEFQPTDPVHQYMHNFVDNQGTQFAKRGGDLLIRDGKQFIHPYKWDPKLAATHWTFDDDDILSGLKIQAQMEAKDRIEKDQKKHEAVIEARKRRADAQNSAVKKDVTQPVTSSPALTSTPSPGASTATPPDTTDIVSSILGFKRQTVQ